ncbi:hypothetical protein GCM10007922_22850 [Shewanella decolorationis]|nr:hypothetical protein GCM10007922_22850 [Shewanella decolorationis]
MLEVVTATGHGSALTQSIAILIVKSEIKNKNALQLAGRLHIRLSEHEAALAYRHCGLDMAHQYHTDRIEL